MIQLIIQRLIFGVATLFVVSALIFFSMGLFPGDFAQIILGQDATPEAVKAIRESLGLDQPAVQRYWTWLSGVVLRGDFGVSFGGQYDISEILLPRFWNTMKLAVTAALVCVPFGVGLGLVAALFHGRWADRILNGSALISTGFPEFFLGYLLIAVLAIQFGWFPAISSVPPGAGFFESLSLLALPSLTIALASFPYLFRTTRASVVNVLSARYVETANLKGLSPWRVVVFHALPNAAGPIINIVTLALAYMIVGTIVVETVFSYPGMGRLLVDSVSFRDLPVVQACCLIFAAVYVALNLIADLIALVADPRRRHPRSA